MHFTETPIPGAYLIDLDKYRDHRGFFARSFCSQEFEQMGLASSFCQMNSSLSTEKGTLRGLHYQLAPAGECKVVRCICGAVYDVILDLREGSPTFGQSFGTLLSDDNRKMLYVPEGCAHGFMTMMPATEMLYMVSAPYHAELERGIRWDDPAFDIDWPDTPTVISDRDRSHPDFSPDQSYRPLTAGICS